MPLALNASVLMPTQHGIDSVLRVLDNVVKNKEAYKEIKERKIKSLNLLLQQEKDDTTRLAIYGDLFNEWKNYQMDSALVVAIGRATLANKMNNERQIFLANMNRAEVMIVTGMYKEALDILTLYDGKITDKKDLQILYHLYHTLYILMSEFSMIDTEKQAYKEKAYLYKDSILSVLPEDDLNRSLVKMTKLIQQGKYEEAVAKANDIYKREDSEYLMAMTLFSLAEAYEKMGEVEQQKLALAMASIEDLKMGSREYLALPELATILYNQGEINRAYDYIQRSLKDAIDCKARLRTIGMAKMIPIINDTYDIKMQKEQRQLYIAMVSVIILAIVLLISVYYIYKKLKELAAARRLLRQMNKNLTEVNKQISQVNQNLNTVNIELVEASKVKEEYIGYVFNMCSLYIDKLDQFRKKVNRQLKGGLVEDCIKQTNSTSLVQNELKEFYKGFDTVFLNIFPHFVEEFHTLLKEGETVYPKDGELLSPELRIYALVRLGINDSVKIASFLHYSPQTVYNYRLKVRSKSFIDRKDFPLKVQQLGKNS